MQSRPSRTPLQRALLFFGVMAFAGSGFLFFGGRVPVEAVLRFELAPTLRAPGVTLAREDIARIDAELVDSEGARAATLSIATPGGLNGPRSPATLVRLKPATYGVRAMVRGPGRLEVPMAGLAEVTEGEVLVDLRSPR
jgi:hypothetical protein